MSARKSFLDFSSSTVVASRWYVRSFSSVTKGCECVSEREREREREGRERRRRQRKKRKARREEVASRA